jgi:DNA-binding response OmpR family regulator
MLYHDKPDLVLLDLMMPEMDGVTLLLRRSLLWKDLPVVVLTDADDRDKLITRAWELRVSDLVPKATFGFKDVLARVKQHLPAAETVGSRRRLSSPRRVPSAGRRLRDLMPR